ncbi:TPA: DNA cytosine methyltransferase, partial [Pseudomonas aeruginosa]|nr:DNA cytosine methyltransferase [Pseudomonas aeruginosa]
PFTTLELAALQSMFDPEDIWRPHPETGDLELVGEPFILHGANDGSWRERIGNAVPRKAGKAIADVMLSTLMLSEVGETFILSSMPVWVRPLAAAISLSRLEHAA